MGSGANQDARVLARPTWKTAPEAADTNTCMVHHTIIVRLVQRLTGFKLASQWLASAGRCIAFWRFMLRQRT